jgi:biopolymer transport protein ExbB
MNIRSHITLLVGLSSAFVGTLCAEEAEAAIWWNTDWTQRQPIILETGADAAAISEGVTSPTLLLRLPYGSFQFEVARSNGADIRFVAEDGKTILPYQIESFDSGLGEGFAWVKLPEAKSGAKRTFYVYYGNQDPAMAAIQPAEAYDGDTSLVYHFAESGLPPIDSTSNKNNAEAPGTTALSAIIGNGMRPLPDAPVSIPNSPTLQWAEGQKMTLSAWVKPDSLQENAVLVSRADGTSSFRLLLDQGVPVVQLGSRRSEAGAPLTNAVWSHLAVVADGTTINLFVNGMPFTTLQGALPALDAAITIGGLTTPATGTGSFTGEFDELTISSTARSASWVKLAAVNQGATAEGQRTLVLGNSEGGEVEEQSHVMQHLSLFGDIAGNMMFDGWIAIGVCAIMIVVGWTVAVKKFVYLNSIEKGTNVFLSQWKALSTDLTALNPDDNTSVSSLGGKVDGSDQRAIEKSPLYHIYQIGADEIKHRLDKDNNRIEGLSGRSIQAIRASLDAGLVHESHKLSNGLVYLTISIAGGPYVGLLGTVVGVMITFAIIAKSGEVNVNSIAPGIASALLATVVGLVVAIPALFIYSYLNGRIKNSLALMQVFIDEFVAKMAEFYRPAKEPEPDNAPR